MGFFEGVVALAGICMITTIATTAIRSKHRGKFSREELANIEDDLHSEMDSRLEKIEKRMANIETIVLDRAKHEEFDKSL